MSPPTQSLLESGHDRIKIPDTRVTDRSRIDPCGRIGAGRQSIAALDDDAELLRLRLTNWGEREETRWIITVMIQHDLYHASEINHLRSLRQGTDRWACEMAEE
jgi:hypothetical protein